MATRDPARRARGERHGKARLTEADIRAILARCRAGAPVALSALEFGVSGRHIRDIRARVYWAHVAEE